MSATPAPDPTLAARYPSMTSQEWQAPAEAPPDPALAARYPTMREGGEKPAAATTPAPEPAPAEQQPAAPVDPQVAAYKVVLPDGFQTDPAALAEFKQLAVANNLPPEAAGSLVKMHHEALAAAKQAEGEDFDRQVEGWRTASLALPELRDPRGPGHDALRAVKALASQPTRTFLDASGLGDHPLLVGWMLKIGLELQRLGGGPARTAQQSGEARYPTMTADLAPKAGTPGGRYPSMLGKW